MPLDLFGAVSTGHSNAPVFAVKPHLQLPGVAAYLAVLDETALDIRFKVDLYCLAAIGTGYGKVIRQTQALDLT